MRTIEVDDEVFSRLADQAVGFHVVPNDVLRRILGLTGPTQKLAVSSTKTDSESSLAAFIGSVKFQQITQAVDRFLVLLAWAYMAKPDEFARVVSEFQRGQRRYFGRSQEEIENSGEGIKAKQIPNSPFWVLTTLDNRTKRSVLEDVLRRVGYSAGETNLAKAQLPDTDMRRRGAIEISHLVRALEEKEAQGK